MKKIILGAIAILMFGNVSTTIIVPPLKIDRIPWQDKVTLFDIVPVYEMRKAELKSPHAKEFVEHITNTEIEKGLNLAVKHFKSRDSVDAKKCMELLALVAGRPDSAVTEKIQLLYNEYEVTLESIEYKEFCGDILYMGLYRTFKRKSDGTVDIDAFSVTQADFFSTISWKMYSNVPGKTFEDRHNDLGVYLS
ncbi:hypothetical protein FACS1894126_4610 [Alphaproteobacteria bacterium]|nr:hypothetical protein FACS1894126_4610 [Alphaproteobacteria bacterium]